MNPVLDSDQSDAFVIGWASTALGAKRVARKWARDHQMTKTPAGLHRALVSLNYDPEVRDPVETDRANEKIGWIIDWAEE